jgi:hypothetical protein
MSDEQKHSVKAPDANVAPSYDQLLRMLVETQKAGIESQKQLADAILESRKPWVDPSVVQQKKAAMEERQRELKRTIAQRVATKAQCPHVRDNGTSNIKWMEHSNNIVKGTCGSCFSEFDTRNPEDLKLLRQDPSSIKKMGRAGAHANVRYVGI